MQISRKENNQEINQSIESEPPTTQARELIKYITYVQEGRGKNTMRREMEGIKKAQTELI